MSGRLLILNTRKNKKSKVLSNHTPVRAIVDWPKGLSSKPVIFPIGDTFEESEQIREHLEGMLKDRG